MNATAYDPAALWNAGEPIYLTRLPEVLGYRLPPFPSLVKTDRAHVCESMSGWASRYASDGVMVFLRDAVDRSAKAARRWAEVGEDSAALAQVLPPLLNLERLPAKATACQNLPTASEPGRVPVVWVETRDGSQRRAYSLPWYRWACHNLAELHKLAILDAPAGKAWQASLAFLGPRDEALALLAPVVTPS